MTNSVETKQRVFLTTKKAHFIDGEWRPKSRSITRTVRDIEYTEDPYDFEFSRYTGSISYGNETIEVVRYVRKSTWTGTMR